MLASRDCEPSLESDPVVRLFAIGTRCIPPGSDALGLTLFGSARYVSRRDLPFTPDMSVEPPAWQPPCHKI